MFRRVVTSVAGILFAAIVHAQCITSSILVPNHFSIAKPRLSPDGALWFVMGKVVNNNTTLIFGVGRMDPATSAITMYTSTSTGQLSDLAFDGTGGMWIADVTNSALVRFDPSIGVVQTVVATLGGYPAQVVRGPDGNLWFTEQNAGKIARLVPATASLTEYSIPQADNPVGITTGPDGNIWFASRGGIGKVTPSGAISMFNGTGFPYRIAVGPDGNLWYTQREGRAVVRITPAGVSTSFNVASARIPADIAAGPDGRIWVTDEGGGSIANVTMDGVVSVLPGIISVPNISPGPRGNLWFGSFDDPSSSSYLNEINFNEPSGSPTIVSVNPTFGSTVGNTPIHLVGTNFQSKATVSFGGAPAGSVTVLSRSDLTAMTPPHAAGLVDVVVTNCNETKATATNAFSYDCQSPSITVQPKGELIKAGGSSTLKVTAVGSTPLTYEWFQGTVSGDPTSAPVPDGKSDTVKVTPAATTSYWVRVSNTCGNAVSEVATVTVCQPPSIKTQPLSQDVSRGGSAKLSVDVTGTLPMSYQWYEGPAGDPARPVVGATGPTFTSGPLVADTSFWVRVANGCGAIQSAAASITVKSASRRRAVGHK